MLEIARRRADDVDAAEVLRRYRSDRFSRPTGFDPEALDRAERLLAGGLPATFDRIVLAWSCRSAPTVWAASIIACGLDGGRTRSRPTRRTASHRVRRSAGASLRAHRAQPRHPAGREPAVLRAQRFEGTATFSHFQIFGLVSAGRDTGDLGFEREAFAEHIAFVRCPQRLAVPRSVELTTSAEARWSRSRPPWATSRRDHGCDLPTGRTRAAAPTTIRCASRSAVAGAERPRSPTAA